MADTEISIKHIGIFGKKLTWTLPDKQIFVNEFSTTNEVRQKISDIYG